MINIKMKRYIQFAQYSFTTKVRAVTREVNCAYSESAESVGEGYYNI